jgi:hypothetical protein
VFCAPGKVEARGASHPATIRTTRRRLTRNLCQRRPIRARTGRACEFYSAALRMSKRLAKLAGFNPFFSGFICYSVNFLLDLFLFLFELLDLIGDGRHGISMIGIDAA